MLKNRISTGINEKQQRVLDEIAEELNYYLLDGNITSFIKNIDPNIDINQIERLLKIHFVLTKKNNYYEVGVIDFIEKLTLRLRRIKTIISPKREILNGNVIGRINWQKTTNLRNNFYPFGDTLFVCEKKERNYDIPENLILKKLIQIVYKIISEDLGSLFIKKSKNTWLKEWILNQNGKEALRDDFYRTFHKNIYIKRITLEKININERMIRKASKSRIELYRDAAYLLEKYLKLMNYDIDPSETKELLKHTFILPKRESVLFELYWLIKIVKLFNISSFENFQYEIRELNQNLVARWNKDGFYYKIYHDSVGNFKLSEDLADLKKELREQNNYFGRELKVREKYNDLISSTSDSFWGGRPDIILEKYDVNNQCIKVFLGEVKSTMDKKYAISGLRELLEYIACLKKNKKDFKENEKDAYKEKYSDMFDDLKYIKGALFTYDIDDLIIKPDKNIKLIKFGNEKELKELIEEF